MPKHYLLSMPILGSGSTLHCYLMTNDARDIEVMGQRMLGVAEARYGEPRMPVILSTPLEPAGKKIVRAHISTNAEIKKLLREATDFHTSVFEMVDGDPVCKKLMELH